jgi:methylglutaconyl-CoA hydratase
LAAKRFIAEQSQVDRKALMKKTAQLIAQLRTSKEGQEGLTAFLEKRNADWIK